MFEIKDNQITLTRGDSAKMLIELTQADGTEYPMQKGDVLTFTLRKKVESTGKLIEKIFNEKHIEFIPEDTVDLDFGNYVYDVVLTTSAGEVYTVVSVSNFVIAKEVHT